jgi:hypothetical protein
MSRACKSTAQVRSKKPGSFWERTSRPSVSSMGWTTFVREPHRMYSFAGFPRTTRLYSCKNAGLQTFYYRRVPTCRSSWRPEILRFIRKMDLAVMKRNRELEVNCYSGRKADERPARFRLDKRDYTVEEVLDQWYGPDDAFYKVRAQDGNVYVLRQQTSDRSWHLAAFRQST